MRTITLWGIGETNALFQSREVSV